jgi:hypothetical protein
MLAAAGAGAASMPEQTIPQTCGMQLKTNNEGPDTLDMVRELGCKVVRRGFIWERIETKAGVYDFSSYDKFMNNCRDRGLKVIGCLAFANRLYGGTVLDAKGREGYAKWAAALAGHYKDYDIIWEIWNEPNTMTFWGKHGGKGNTPQYADEYSALVKETAPAMHKANPKCIVQGGAVSAFWEPSFVWMGACFKNGLLKMVDAWSVHPYGTKSPEDAIAWYARLRKMMTESGAPADFPILNSERGYPLGKAEGYAGGDPKMAGEYQAWHIVRQYLVDHMCGIKATVWYEWGGTEGFAVYTGKDKTQPYIAAKVMMEQLGGYAFDRRINVASDRDFVLRFTNKSGGVKLAAWAAPPAEGAPDKIKPHDVSIPVEGKGSLTLVGIYGEKGAVDVKGGSISLTLSGAPQYVTVSDK